MGTAVFIWILCGIAGAAMLSRFNKAGIGCLLGGILGPIGLLIAWAIRDDEKLDAHEGQGGTSSNQDSRPRYPCPFCAEYILHEAQVCKHCGRDVRPRSSSSGGSRSVKDGDPDLVECAWCGKEIGLEQTGIRYKRGLYHSSCVGQAQKYE